MSSTSSTDGHFLRPSSRRHRSSQPVSSSPGQTPRTELDDQGCLVVADIVESFNTPISEEHAWAICYQAAKCGQGILSNDNQKDSCLLVTSIHHLIIHKDGHVHPATFLDLQENGKGKSSLVSIY